jgi:hypothetical protein
MHDAEGHEYERILASVCFSLVCFLLHLLQLHFELKMRTTTKTRIKYDCLLLMGLFLYYIFISLYLSN